MALQAEQKKQVQKEKELKNSENLAKAIAKLSEQFIKAGEEIKRGPKQITTAGAMGQGVRAHFAPVMAAAKQIATPAGMLDILAAKSGGGLMSSILGTASGALKQRAEAREKKTNWASSFLTGTDTGRGLIEKHGMEKASGIAGKYYDTKNRLDADISAVEERRAQLRSSGIKGADLSQADLEALAKKKRQVDYLMGSKKPSAPKKKPEPVALPPMMPEPSLADSLYNSQLPALKQQFPEETKSREFLADYKKGIEEELLELNEEQLVALKALVKNSMVSEEDRFEAEKAKKVGAQAEKVLNKPKPVEAQGGIMDTLMKKFSGVGALGLGAAAGIGAAALPFATAALGAGAAGFAGYKAGGLMNKFVLDPLAGAITGDKNDTVGTALYSGVDKLKGMFGMKTDAQKLADADIAAKIALGTKRLAGGQQISKDIASTMTAAGIAVPANMILEPGKPPVVAAAMATTNLTNKTDAVDQAKALATEGKVIPAAAASSTTVVNTNNSTNYSARPELRTSEPTFNRILARNFS